MPDPHPPFFTTPDIYTSCRAGVARAGCARFGLVHLSTTSTENMAPSDGDLENVFAVQTEIILTAVRVIRSYGARIVHEVLDAAVGHRATHFEFDADKFVRARDDLIYYANQWGPRDSYGIEIWELLSTNQATEVEF